MFVNIDSKSLQITLSYNFYEFSFDSPKFMDTGLLFQRKTTKNKGKSLIPRGLHTTERAMVGPITFARNTRRVLRLRSIGKN